MLYLFKGLTQDTPPGPFLWCLFIFDFYQSALHSSTCQPQPGFILHHTHHFPVFTRNPFNLQLYCLCLLLVQSSVTGHRYSNCIVQYLTNALCSSRKGWMKAVSTTQVRISSSLRSPQRSELSRWLVIGPCHKSVGETWPGDKHHYIFTFLPGEKQLISLDIVNYL